MSIIVTLHYFIMCNHLSGLSLYHVMACGLWNYPMGKEGPVSEESFKGEIWYQNFFAFVIIPIAVVESWWFEDGKCGWLLGPHIIRHSAMFYVSVVWLHPLLLLWKATEIVKHHLNFSHHSRYKLGEVLCRKNRRIPCKMMAIVKKKMKYAVTTVNIYSQYKTYITAFFLGGKGGGKLRPVSRVALILSQCLP